jgi:enamine deaminase RidA (YjgF/YER057c/UK114 family)
MTDLKNFSAFDEAWKEFFKVLPPRTTAGTTGLLVKEFSGVDRFCCGVYRSN